MSIKPSEITLRELILEDLPAYSYYWFHCIDSTHVQQHINRKNFPTEEQFDELMKKRLNSGEDIASFVVVYKEKAIGVFSLTNRENESADIHAHFWDASARGKGIGRIAGILAARAFFKKYNLNKLYLKPPVDNHMSSKLAKKLGLNHQGQEEYQSPMIIDGIIVNIYELTLEDLERLEREVTP